MRRSLCRNPRSQSCSSAASITLWEDPKAAASLAMSVALRARDPDDAGPALALARRPRRELLGCPALGHQPEGLHLGLGVGTLDQLVQLRVEHRDGVLPDPR